VAIFWLVHLLAFKLKPFPRYLNPTEAKDMFISTLRWRQSFDVEGAMKEKFPEDIFGKLGKIYGKDNQGHPVSYVPPNRHMTAPKALLGTTFTAQTRISMLFSVTSSDFCGKNFNALEGTAC